MGRELPNQHGSAEVESLPRRLTIGNIVVRLFYAWVIFGLIVLSLRVFLLAFSASKEAPFVTFIYQTSDRYLEPFRGIFAGREVGETGYFDVSALFAIIMYLFVAWGVMSLIAYINLKIDRLHDEQKQQLRAATRSSKVGGNK